MAYIGLGDYRLAIDDFTYAMVLNPKYEEAYYQRSMAYLWRGACTAGEEDFAEMLKINPDSSFKVDVESAIASCKQIEEF